MAIKVNYIQSLGHGASWLREQIESEFTSPGVLQGLAVTTTGSFTLNIAAGKCIVAGTGSILSGAYQGSYHVINDATAQVTIGAPPGANTRVDQIIMQVADATELGGSTTGDGGTFQVIQGTAGASNTLTTLTGLGTVPSSSLVVGYVEVGVGVGSIASNKVATAPRPLAVQNVVVQRIATQSMPNASAQTPVQFDTGVVDYPNTGASWTVADPGKVYARQTGLYHIQANVNIAQDVNGNVRVAAIRINGVTNNHLAEDVKRPLAGGIFGVAFSLGGIMPLTAGNYAELIVAHDATGSLNIGGAAPFAGSMGMRLLR